MGIILVQVGRRMFGGDGPLITFVTFLRHARGEGRGGEVSKSRVGVARGHGCWYTWEKVWLVQSLQLKRQGNFSNGKIYIFTGLQEKLRLEGLG